ncbi:uncharacterized [Tachysurus ichikawai]
MRRMKPSYRVESIFGDDRSLLERRMGARGVVLGLVEERNMEGERRWPVSFVPRRSVCQALSCFCAAGLAALRYGYKFGGSGSRTEGESRTAVWLMPHWVLFETRWLCARTLGFDSCPAQGEHETGAGRN